MPRTLGRWDPEVYKHEIAARAEDLHEEFTRIAEGEPCTCGGGEVCDVEEILALCEGRATKLQQQEGALALADSIQRSLEELERQKAGGH